MIKLINDENLNDQMAGNIVSLQGLLVTTDSSGNATFDGVPSATYPFSQMNPCIANPNPLPTVTAEPNKTVTAELHVRRIPSVIKIKQLTFTGNNPVDKDTDPLGFGPTGSADWEDGRPQEKQYPVAYARNKNVGLTAVFTVVTAPLCDESVEVKGSATFGSASLEWISSVTVHPGDKGKVLPGLTLTSNNALPDAVGIFESSDISWQMNPGKRGFSPAGVTRNVIYVTLGNPAGTPNYWTLLDVSCRGAQGETTESGLINKAFSRLKLGPGHAGISRKRDNQPLTYWKPMPPPNCARNTLQLLKFSGAGECGSWAAFLIDMYKVHGVTTADKVLIVRTQTAHPSEGFLVKHWVFRHPPPSKANAYTHTVPSECDKGVHLPGQNNSSPPASFYNHFIVRADGKFWDPSYGAGPFADQKSWENAAIDGLLLDLQSGGQRAGFDKSLNATTNILEFWSMSTWPYTKI